MPSCSKQGIVRLSLSLSYIPSYHKGPKVLSLLSSFLVTDMLGKGAHQFANTTNKFRQLIPHKQTRTASMSLETRNIQFNKSMLRLLFKKKKKTLSPIEFWTTDFLINHPNQTKIYKQHQKRNYPRSITNINTNTLKFPNHSKQANLSITRKANSTINQTNHLTQNFLTQIQNPHHKIKNSSFHT